MLLLTAETTDTPVWWLFGATLTVAAFTAVLAVAAIKALGQVKVALQEVEEGRHDRHVEAFAEWGRRWVGPEITEALIKETEYGTPARIADLFAKPPMEPSRNPLRERRRKRENRDRIILLRIPDYFEDVAMTAKAGDLKAGLVKDHVGGLAVDEWELWGPTIKMLQKGDPLSYIEFERLAKAIRAEDKARESGASPSS